MICKSQPRFLEDKPDKISDLWEIRLPVTLWQAVHKAARERRVTFSTITRFCLFQLAERSSLRMREAVRKLVQQDRDEYRQASSFHRHVVCLYGEDVQMIRLAAMQLGVTVSCLVRLALRLFLTHFAMEKHNKRQPSDAALFWCGIKRACNLITVPQNYCGIFSSRHFYLQSFPPELRWGWPQAATAEVMPT